MFTKSNFNIHIGIQVVLAGRYELYSDTISKGGCIYVSLYICLIITLITGFFLVPLEL